MVCHEEKLLREFREHLRGGEGGVEMLHFIGKDEMQDKGRLFARLTLAPGASIGEHTHVGDSETFYFLSGSGVYNDNGTVVPVAAGDVAFAAEGTMHGIVNNGDEDLVFVALILYA